MTSLEEGFVKGQSDNLPQVDNITMFSFLGKHPDFMGAEMKGVKAKRKARPHDLCWMVNREELDIEYYLPIFCDGLEEDQYPFTILARDGAIELLEVAGERALPVLPQIAQGIKKALNTENPEIMMNACAVIQRLATISPLVSLALIRHYRKLLVPFFSKYKTKEIPYRMGEINYGQRKRNLADVINQTLEVLDRTGGPDAYAEIKYAVPTYHSAYHHF